MDKKIGFIGCGNMAKAIIDGILQKHTVRSGQIMASAKSEQTIKEAADRFGIETTTKNRYVAIFADILVIAVKPQFMAEVIAEIKNDVREDQLIVTLAPGKTLAWLEEQFGGPHKFVRTMPNTPALVGEAMSALCPGAGVSEEDMCDVQLLFQSFGKTSVVSEPMIDVVTGVSGSSPAYVFLFIEAMADAAVHAGMPRAQAYTFAAQAVLGSAKMVLETGMHPGALKDMVCSPGGTTIEAVRVLEEKGMRSAVFEATKACIDKARGL